MALDPSIALGVKPIEIANPLVQYGQIAQLQAAQNQNSLAQYQLGAAQRAEAKDVARTNMLSQAGTDDTAIANALLKSGDLKGYSDFVKTRRETLKADTELVDAKLKQSRQFLDTINPADPNAPAQYLAWHQANHKDPVLGPALAARGVTADQSMARIQQAIKAGPQAFAELLNQSRLGTEKFMELNKPQYITQDLGGSSRVSALPGLGGAPTTLSDTKKTMTFADTIAQGRLGVEQQRLAQEATSVTYQPDANNQIVALPTKLKKGEVPTARVAVAPGGGFQPLQGKPSEAEGKEIMSLNQQKAVLDGALKQVKANPSAFGAVRGAMGETLGGKYHDTPEEAQARAYAFNVVSSVIHARAGTAQTPGERETLLRFLPGEYDDAKQVENKINAYLKYVGDMEKGTTKKRGGPEKPPLAPVDQQALQWANSNPADPRAAAIKQRLGM